VNKCKKKDKKIGKTDEDSENGDRIWLKRRKNKGNYMRTEEKRDWGEKARDE